MSKQFDPQQQQVLDNKSQHQLVSASAGSGKTTVMIQKITDLLLSKQASPDELLVVTFTNLASTEMRERLSTNLTQALINASTDDQKAEIQNILDGIQTASVDTIDGFCSKMLKKYFYQADVEPEIKIISAFSQEYYINKAMDLAIKQFGVNNEDELIVLCDIFEKKSRSLETLKQCLLSAFNYCICQKSYDTFLANTIGQYQDLNSSSIQYLNKYICDTINRHIFNVLRVLPNFTDYPKLHKMIDGYCSHLLQVNINQSIVDNANVLNTAPACSFSNTERIQKGEFNYEYLKFNIDIVRDLIADTQFLNNLQHKSFDTIAVHLNSFINLLQLFIQSYDKLKADNGVMDFGDLERKVLELLQNQQIIEDVHNTYKYVFVDEYQDINPMQDELINTLLSSSANLFLVGDVKQSIYGFRQSTPELFINAYKNYKQDNNSGTAFDMNINFRSAPEILKFNNEIFSHLMTENDADIDYASTSQFEPKRTDFPSSSAVEIEIANTDIEQETTYANGIYSVVNHKNPVQTLTSEQIEVQIVVNKIKSLVGTEFYDSNLKQNRKLEFKDIAILSRSISNDKVQNLANALSSNNIPINISKRSNIKDCEALAKILSILRILSRTASDIDYTYLLTSPMVNVEYSELLTVYTDKTLSLYDNLQTYISNNNNDLSIKIKYGLNLCEELRIAHSSLNIVELIDAILNKYHLRQYILSSNKGYQQLTLLDEFINSLSNEEKNTSIPKFIDLLQKNLNTSKELVSRDSLNSVTIQTIHASKGLEYPIVILFNCSQQFKYITEHNDLNFDTEFGIGMQYYDLNLRKRYESPTRYAIKLRNCEKSYKEELRLLYVATTRAKNKLIITGCCSEDKLKSNTLSKDNYLNLILSTYYSKINTNPLLDKYQFANCKININISAEQQNEVSKTFKPTINDKAIANLYYEYPYMAETNISIKNNVTALSRTLNEEYNIVPIKLNLKENLQAMSDDLAQIGTAYHNELSSINYNLEFDYTPNDDAIDANLIKTAYDKISVLAKNCINQYNEKQFMMYVPYNQIYTDSLVETKVLVQGVVDLILEFDNHIILIDYKYSNSSIHNLTKKYATQIMLYKMAIEKAFKKPVLASYIYSIKSGELAQPT